MFTKKREMSSHKLLSFVSETVAALRAGAAACSRKESFSGPVN